MNEQNNTEPYLDNSAGVELTDALKLKIAQFRILGEPVLIEKGKCVWLENTVPAPLKAAIEHSAAEMHYSGADQYFTVLWFKNQSGYYLSAACTPSLKPRRETADNPLKRGGLPDAPGFGGGEQA